MFLLRQTSHGGETKTSFEFLRGHFGGPPPHGAVRFVAADPIDACGTLYRSIDIRVELQ